MKSYWLKLKQLDAQLKSWKAARDEYSTPKAGWVKTIRSALGMTQEQLANRLGLSIVRVEQLESAEADRAITVRSLQAAANAMGCEFIYALVPKADLTLESIVKAKIEQTALESISRVAHSMTLEDQAVESNFLKIQKMDTINELMANPSKQLWKNELQEHFNKHKKPRTNLLKKK